MTRIAPALVLIAAAGLAGACAKKSTAKVATTTDRAPRPTTPAAEATPASPSLGVTQDLAELCKLALGNPGKAPKFDYNDDALHADDRDVLERVATCLTSGPLKGRAVRLVGRADPRGTTEYNLGLGTRRATSVVDYLKRLGVGPKQLVATTRGSIDAAGRDEDGWREDRRVDLELVR